MEVDSSVNHVVAKRLWNMVRVALFMLRKGVVLKRKMMVDVHLLMKRGKVLGKTLGSLMFHHSHGKTHYYSSGFGVKEYEFSCSNSPAPPLAFHMAKRKHHYFPSIPRLPCIQPHAVDDNECCSNAIVVSQSEYFTKNNIDLSELPAADESTPLSPYYARGGSEEVREHDQDQVDREAEEFISRFYEQIRLQRQVSFIQYDEMLARGAK